MSTISQREKKLESIIELEKNLAKYRTLMFCLNEFLPRLAGLLMLMQVQYM